MEFQHGQTIALPAAKQTVYIYALIDSEDVDRAPHYVGQTFNPIGRLAQHCNTAKGASGKRLTEWIRHLQTDGRLPEMLILEVCGSREANDREKHWIAWAAQRNCYIANGERFLN